MNNLILITLTLLISASNAQSTKLKITTGATTSVSQDRTIESDDKGNLYYTVDNSKYSICYLNTYSDTIKSKLLVTSDDGSNVAYYIIGYEVCNPGYWYNAICYLDDKKKPFKNITVWISSPLKDKK